jgi:hypothetical protein
LRSDEAVPNIAIISATNVAAMRAAAAMFVTASAIVPVLSTTIPTSEDRRGLNCSCELNMVAEALGDKLGSHDGSSMLD